MGLSNTPTASTASVVASGLGEAFGLGAGSNIKVIADKDNNALLILANAAEYESGTAIKSSTLCCARVLAEVTIAEVTLTGALSYGLEWFFSSNNNLSGMLFNSTPNSAHCLQIQREPLRPNCHSRGLENGNGGSTSQRY